MQHVCIFITSILTGAPRSTCLACQNEKSLKWQSHSSDKNHVLHANHVESVWVAPVFTFHKNTCPRHHNSTTLFPSLVKPTLFDLDSSIAETQRFVCCQFVVSVHTIVLNIWQKWAHFVFLKLLSDLLIPTTAVSLHECQKTITWCKKVCLSHTAQNACSLNNFVFCVDASHACLSLLWSLAQSDLCHLSFLCCKLWRPLLPGQLVAANSYQLTILVLSVVLSGLDTPIWMKLWASKLHLSLQATAS